MQISWIFFQENHLKKEDVKNQIRERTIRVYI